MDSESPLLRGRERERAGGRVGSLALAATSLALLPLFASAAEPAKKVTFEDDVVPIFRDNCLKCHNPDKLKGDLDLTSFGNTLKGGGSGAAVNAGDPEGSQLFKSITHADEPTMPPNAKLAPREIAIIRDWIAGGLLQGQNSKAIAGAKPAVDLAIKSGSVGRPEGPPPLPGRLAFDPVVRAARGSALAAVAASPWAPVVALAGARQIVLHRTDDLEFLGVLPFPDGSPADVKFSRNGKLLLAGGGRGGKSGLVTVWDIATTERVITIGDQFDTVLAADLSANQQWIALGGPDRVLKIYGTKDGALEHRLKKHTDWVTAVEFSPDGKVLASGDRNGGLILWDAANGQEMFTLPGHKGAITAISWRDDAEMLVSASEDGTLKLWKARDGASLRSLNAHPGGVLAARFAHDDRIVSSGRDNKVQIWNTTGKNVATAAFTGDLPNRVAFSDDGKRIIASDWQGRVLVFDATSGKAVGELDSAPPPLAERVARDARRITELQATIDQAPARKAILDAEAAVAQANADLERKALANARAKGVTDPAGLKALNERVAAATKQATEAAKQAAEAGKVVDEAREKIAATKRSLERWQAVLKEQPPSPTGSKVSVRE
ncbi:MAG: hypothetical protein JNL39_23090 [Opitutaceae bacterium]|nr:hypothetical protein [Opitutaceae bacterium]